MTILASIFCVFIINKHTKKLNHILNHMVYISLLSWFYFHSVHVKSISHSHFFLLDKCNLHKHTTVEAAKDADETHSFLLGPFSPGAHIINYS